MFTFLLSLLALFALQNQRTELPQSKLCGMSSVFTILQLSGKDVPFAEVRSRFEKLSGRESDGSSGQSILQVKKVLSSFGLEYTGYHYKDRDLQSLSTPCILYIEPDDVGHETLGHFVVLGNLKGNSAELIDFSASPAVFTTEIDSLRDAWEGRSIETISKSRLPFGLTAAILLGLLLALTWIMFSFRKRESATVFVLLCFCCICGCSRENKSSLQTDSWVVDLGKVELRNGDPALVVRKIPFRNSGLSDLEITSISSSCGCAAVSEGIVGRKFKPGELFKLPIQLNLNSSRIGLNELKFVIETSEETRIFTCRCFVTSFPRLAPEKILVEIPFESDRMQVFDLTASWHRYDHQSPLRLNLDSCDLQGFSATVGDTQSVEISRVSPEPIVLDKAKIVVSCDPKIIASDQSYELVFFWNDGTNSKVEVRVEKQSFVLIPFQSIQVGKQVKSATGKVSVPLSFNVGPLTLEIETNCERGKLNLEIEDLRQQDVVLSFKCPSVVGRFEIPARIKATSEDGTIETYQLQIVGFIPEINSDTVKAGAIGG